MTLLNSLTDQISSNIIQGRLNRALRLIRNNVIKECVSGKYVNKKFSSIELDTFCEVISSKLNPHLQNDHKTTKHSHNIRPSTIIIASKITKTGGVFRCLFDLADELKLTQDVTLITTEFCGSSDNFLNNDLDGEMGLRWVKIGPSSPVNKVLNVKKTIKKIAPDYVWLFSNHEDSVAISSINKNSSYKTIFFHHADDRLSLGASLKHFIHANIFPSTHTRALKNGLPSIYMPVGYFKETNLNSSLGLKVPLVSATVARSHKLSIHYKYPYYKMIPLLLKNGLQKHIHIGNLNFFIRFLIFCNLLRNNIESNKFVYIKSHENYLETLNTFNVGLCIMSFPFGAGKTAVEVMSHGIPILIHRQANNPNIISKDLIYPGHLSWESPEQLVAIISTMTSSSLKRHSKLGILYVTQNFSYSFYKASIKNVLQYNLSSNTQKSYNSKSRDILVDYRINFYNLFFSLLKIIRSDLSLFF